MNMFDKQMKKKLTDSISESASAKQHDGKIDVFP